MNYLPDARNHGAEIFTQCSVKYVEKEPDGTWTVHFEWLGSGRGEFNAPPMFVRADVVILSAGTLGSTEIMLRSRARGLPASGRVGHHFSGNGDVLGFAYDCKSDIQGIGYGHRKPNPEKPVGPCITSVIDRTATARVEDGSIIEEGSIPGAISRLLPVAFAAADVALGHDGTPTFEHHMRELEQTLESVALGAHEGADARTQTYLVMAHDGGDGNLLLENDRLRIHWPGVGRRPVFQSINQELQDATQPLEGCYVEDPIWAKTLGSNLITVHPLGGCAMGDDAARGVVNDRGQVFSAAQGTAVHDGLYVADGSVIPNSLGVNPLFTISAVSERIVSILAQERGWTIDYALPSARPADWPVARPGIRFTETMKGFWSQDPAADYAEAAAAGRTAGQPLQFTLTIQGDDVERMISDPAHRASMVGTVICPALSPDPLTVTGGEFHLFVNDAKQAGAKQMIYRMVMRTEEGRAYHFSGFKEMTETSALSAWEQTTTLYVAVRDGDSETAPVLGKGILKIAAADFARQMTTMTVTSAKSYRERLLWLERFGRFFAGNLWDQYGGVVGAFTHLEYEESPRKRRPLRVGAPEVHDFMTADDVRLRLTRYRGGSRGPVILSHGLGVSSLIFSIDTIGTNLLEHLYGQGYDCWLLDYRCSTALPQDARKPATGDDVAKYDYPAAIKTVKALTGAPDVQVVAHCYGATTFTLALLGGYVDPKDVRSLVISQISANVHSPAPTRVKSALRLPNVLQVFGFGTLTAYTDRRESWIGKLFDRFAAVYAWFGAQGRCHDPVCHRITFLYGPLYKHDTLNDDTHNVLHEMFGLAAIDQFKHLAAMVRARKVVDARGKDVYYPHLTRMAVPTCFIHGAENRCFLPSSTEETKEVLSKANGADLYTRHVIPGYGHIDCIYGENASVDVFPHISAHLEKTATLPAATVEFTGIATPAPAPTAAGAEVRPVAG
jgi:cholesterol oxidase